MTTPISSTASYAQKISQALQACPAADRDQLAVHSYSWLLDLPEGERTEFIDRFPGVVTECAETENFFPLSVYLDYWAGLAKLNRPVEI